MDETLQALRALAEPTRLRLLALCARGAFCVSELTEILGQSQPRLSRHLKLLTAAGLLRCSREGAHAWFGARDGGLAQAVLAALPADDPALAADRRAAARVLAERARVASALFRGQGADWDEMRALGLDAEAVEAAVTRLLTAHVPGARTLLDIGTGTGRLLEVCAALVPDCLGVDASPAMLALARTRLARAGLAHCRVEQADAYRLTLADGTVDIVTLQMVLHHAEDPRAMLREAARVLRPGGLLLVIDLAAGGDEPPGLRWPGFAEARMTALLREAGMVVDARVEIDGPYTVSIWPARRVAMRREEQVA